MKLIDEGLTAQNLRHVPLYKYVHLEATDYPEGLTVTAKFQEYLSWENLTSFAISKLKPQEARVEIARRLGKLHSATHIKGRLRILLGYLGYFLN